MLDDECSEEKIIQNLKFKIQNKQNDSARK